MMFLVVADRPARTLSRDDFPAPLGPKMAQTCPWLTWETEVSIPISKSAKHCNNKQTYIAPTISQNFLVAYSEIDVCPREVVVTRSHCFHWIGVQHRRFRVNYRSRGIHDKSIVKLVDLVSNSVSLTKCGGQSKHSVAWRWSERLLCTEWLFHRLYAYKSLVLYKKYPSIQ